jgi:hypothetical protein
MSQKNCSAGFSVSSLLHLQPTYLFLVVTKAFWISDGLYVEPSATVRGLSRKGFAVDLLTSRAIQGVLDIEK